MIKIANQVGGLCVIYSDCTSGNCQAKICTGMLSFFINSNISFITTLYKTNTFIFTHTKLIHIMAYA